MAKNIVQDVIPRESRKTIRDISLDSSEKTSSHSKLSREKNFEPQQREEPHFNNQSQEIDEWNDVRKPVKRHWPLWALGMLSAGVLIFVVGNLFAGATVAVTPKTQAVTLNLDLTASPKAEVGEIEYTPVVWVRDLDELVPSDGERRAEVRASGKIIIYNNYSVTSQRLVKNTRFETPDGLIYKIADSLTVPGRRNVSGKIIPGSIEALVYAESAGEEYNIGLTDFTVPGFKSNSERFTNFYGRSKTSMTGGRIGTEKFVSEEKLAEVRKRLQLKLEKGLQIEALSEVPSDSILYDTAYRITFEPVLAGSADRSDSITVRERARFTGFLLKKNALAAAIAKNTLGSYDGSPVRIGDMESLKFKLGANTTNSSGATVGPIKFNLKGSAEVVWLVDEEKLKIDLVGKERGDLEAVAAKHPSIVKADVTFRPVWKNSFPASAFKIKVVISNEEK